MPRAMKSCSTVGCPELVYTGRCSDCTAKAEKIRGTARERGYGNQHATRFRPGVLRRDPLCVCSDRRHGHGAQCLAPSVRADHYPRSRRELVEAGLDPDDPQYGRGLCKSCDSKQTSVRQPGGWNAR